MSDSITIHANGSAHAAELVHLLQQANLPAGDLPEGLPHFFTARANDRVVGAIGLEPYGKAGLLRSLVVDPSFRNRGIADRLVARIEQEATALGLEHLYLLTTTAAAYFLRKGFGPADRSTVPEALKSASEFTHSCPASATLLKKDLTGV